MWLFVFISLVVFQSHQRPIHSQKRASCIKSAAGLFPCCHQLSRYQDAFASLAPLNDNKSAASCQQAWCKLIVKTFYPQAWCKLFQQLVASLQISSCNKSDFHRLTATWLIQQTCCNLLTTCSKLVKCTTCISGCVVDLHNLTKTNEYSVMLMSISNFMQIIRVLLKLVQLIYDCDRSSVFSNFFIIPYSLCRQKLCQCTFNLTAASLLLESFCKLLFLITTCPQANIPRARIE